MSKRCLKRNRFNFKKKSVKPDLNRSVSRKDGAGGGDRTRGPRLGKAMLSR